MENQTPMMMQYKGIKKQYSDTILFFRMGDFYEMFEDDALSASQLLNITLTKRNGVPMCGVPYHAAQNYIAKLLKAGRKIAICEQTRVPGPGKGIAEREVIEVITPGTVIDENLLEKDQNNFLVSIARDNDFLSISYLDLSTADFFAAAYPLAEKNEVLKKELLRLSPREILVQESFFSADPILKKILYEREDLLINRFPDWKYSHSTLYLELIRQFQVTNLKGFGLAENSTEILAAGIILDYLKTTAKNILAHIQGIQTYQDSQYLYLDESSQRNLELIHNLQDGSRHYTLYEVLNQCRTAMGNRKLRQWLLRPLMEIDQIISRQNIINFLYHNQILQSKTKEILGNIYDLERLSSRIAMDKANAKDLISLKYSLHYLGKLLDLLSAHKEIQEFTDSALKHTTVIDLSLQLIERSIKEEPALLLHEGNLIKTGYNQELDELLNLQKNSRHILARILEDEKQKNNLPSLKLKYNRIIGHFFELSKTNAALAPAHFILRQTLVNGERYTTGELAETQSRISEAEEKIFLLEKTLFLEIRAVLKESINPFFQLATFVAELDVYQSLAYVATIYGYTRPEILETNEIAIKDGRHPVVEYYLKAGDFVPNDSALHPESHLVLLTGPNMAGKSTFLRQTALIVLMAQIGSFVPAAEARIGITDKIFCRVGASDNLARGESTFLVEMNETANILRAATPRSLIIMDEVGRGTSTNDGLAIAWAVIEYILHQLKSKTLFATHFHELTRIEHPHLVNMSMDVLEEQDTVVFLKKIKAGPSNNSYGIHVARMAGIPEQIIQAAYNILAEICLQNEKESAEIAKLTHSEQPLFHPNSSTAAEPTSGMLFPWEELLSQELRGLDLNTLTPLKALNLIAKWQKELNDRPA